MATHKPGRLARTLAAVTGSGPYFGLYSPALGTLYDSEIISAVTHRGKQSRGGGVHPATLEVAVKGAPVLGATGTNVSLTLREGPAARLAAHTGVSADRLRARYSGRLGQVDTEDTGTRLTTTYSAGSWLARLNRSPVHSTPTAGQNLRRVLSDLFKLSTPLAGINVTFHGDFDTLAETTDPVLYKDAIDRYTTNLGILVRETRAGVSQVLPLPYRITAAAAALSTAVPLTRSQAISPARWQQRNEAPPMVVEYWVTNENGFRVQRSVSVESTGETPETRTEDWGYIRADTNQLYHHAYGMVYESNPRQFAVPSVKVDLLYLLASPHKYHRDQAGQLLALEAGDPVFFSADWPSSLAGVHFAEGITETINTEEWTLELALVPYAHAMGVAPSPKVPARVWTSARYPWKDESRIWRNA